MQQLRARDGDNEILGRTSGTTSESLKAIEPGTDQTLRMQESSEGDKNNAVNALNMLCLVDPNIQICQNFVF